MPVSAVGEKRITPSRFHDPPRGLPPTSQMVSGGPPWTSIFFNFESTKKASLRLSGDQNGETAPSVPGSALASSESSERIHNTRFLSSPTAAKTMRLPSGEIATDTASYSRKLN